MVKIKRSKKIKKSSNSYRRIGRLLRVTIISVGLVGAGYGSLHAAGYLSRLPYFEIKKIEVNGNRRLTDEQLVELSGIGYKQNIYKINLDDISEGLHSHPYIEKVVVERKLPETVRIQVEERQGVAVVKVPGAYYLVDAEGIVLENLGAHNEKRWPIIVGINPELICLGKTIGEGSDLVNFLYTKGQLKSFKYIDLSRVSDPVLITSREGIEVHLGQAEWKKKIKRFNLVYQGLRARTASVKYIDLRYSHMVVVKQKYDS